MKDRGKLHHKNLQTLFYPKSVAVIGTNKVTGTVPGDIFINILHADLQGIIYPVSPREKSIGGVKAYKYVIDIEEEVDLAVIVFPSSVAKLALEQCGQKGIKSVIIISAGFREVGEKGQAKEKELLEIAEKYDISFIGPNCLGVINTDPVSRLNASFARKFPAEGNIAFLSQSGALCTAVLDYAQAKNIGFSKFVSFGNKTDISEIDLLYYLMEDKKTKVILLYLEEITDGPGLMKAARDVIEKSHKPILIIKSGRTEEGASAAASHTGSLAGKDEICDAAFKQAGIIRCENIEEMFNIAIAFVYQPEPKLNRIAIITNAGGPGVLTTDAAIKSGIHLAQFSEETTLALKRSLPSTANINNPVDVIGDARADRYVAAISAAFKDENVDGLFVILTPQSMTDINTIAKEIATVASQFDKPIYTSFMGEADVASGIQILQKHNIPHYILPESMCKPFMKVYQFHQQISKSETITEAAAVYKSKEAKKRINSALNSNKKFLHEFEATQIVSEYKLPVLKSGLTTSAEEAAEVAKTIGFPVVMKVMSEKIVHKFDVGGVILNINSEIEAAEAFLKITDSVQKILPGIKIDGILVSKQVPEGLEVILGIKKDPSFGDVIMFGIGGIFVEIFKDVSFRVAPIQKNVAFEMIQEIKASKLLLGARGKKPADIECLAETIVKLSNLALDNPNIKELDINPLIVLELGKGCFVADAKIVLK
ncbi:acetate--CoA ligase family protein [Prolixibacteraceae bacterium Z1-6]|uniref:Acetate--CoA ligase family protein n=1 Tax=Draconibacterium aestuarii TaxID=2998507 RepID=A0A9X3F525_9BACT|nr:acetate--CoA ligase family protein [Prolixibacteraceae bacterium Z1-6]